VRKELPGDGRAPCTDGKTRFSWQGTERGSYLVSVDKSGYRGVTFTHEVTDRCNVVLAREVKLVR
jgi:hypothetical protein